MVDVCGLRCCSFVQVNIVVSSSVRGEEVNVVRRPRHSHVIQYRQMTSCSSTYLFFGHHVGAVHGKPANNREDPSKVWTR